ncbi:hypothetical protein HK102_007525 [Quaeritorhiza haematococci]|nr:hypothetical protein HK102_007525 [Quaeritorhiza haematococci]
MNKNEDTIENIGACESMLLYAFGLMHTSGKGSQKNVFESSVNGGKPATLSQAQVSETTTPDFGLNAFSNTSLFSKAFMINDNTIGGGNHFVFENRQTFGKEDGEEQQPQQQQENKNVTPPHCIVDYSGRHHYISEPEFINENDVVEDKEKKLDTNLSQNPNACARMPWYPSCARQKTVLSNDFEDMVVSVLASAGVETESTLESEPGTPRLNSACRKGPRFQRLGEGTEGGMWTSWDKIMCRQKENIAEETEEEKQNVEDVDTTCEEYLNVVEMSDYEGERVGCGGDYEGAEISSDVLVPSDGAVLDALVENDGDRVGCGEEDDGYEGAGTSSEDVTNAPWQDEDAELFQLLRSIWRSWFHIAPATPTDQAIDFGPDSEEAEYESVRTEDVDEEKQRRDNISVFLEPGECDACQEDCDSETESEFSEVSTANSTPCTDNGDFLHQLRLRRARRKLEESSHNHQQQFDPYGVAKSATIFACQWVTAAELSATIDQWIADSEPEVNTQHASVTTTATDFDLFSNRIGLKRKRTCTINEDHDDFEQPGVSEEIQSNTLPEQSRVTTPEKRFALLPQTSTCDLLPAVTSATAAGSEHMIPIRIG